MAVFAECLPVFLVPEQILVAPVGDDVIHHRRRGESAFLPALNAQRMSAQVFIRLLRLRLGVSLILESRYS